MRFYEILFGIPFHNQFFFFFFAKIISSHLNTPTNHFISHNFSLCLTNHFATILFRQGSLYARAHNFAFRLLNHHHPRVVWFIVIAQAAKHYMLLSMHKLALSPCSPVDSWLPLTLYVHIKLAYSKVFL